MRSFPLLACYGAGDSAGVPLTTGWDGPIRPEVLAHFAKYDICIVQATPFGDLRHDLLQALRAQRPRRTVMAYIMPCSSWLVSEAAGPWRESWYYRKRKLEEQTGAFLVYRGQRYPGMDVNLALQMSDGFPHVEALALLAAEKLKWADGIYCDVMPTDAWWAGDLDYNAAGYRDFGTFDNAWRVAVEVLCRRLREAFPNAVLIGNAGLPALGGTVRSSVNGWMRENFPYLPGGSWQTSMVNFNSVPGLLYDEGTFRAPTLSTIFTNVREYMPNYVDPVTRWTIPSRSLETVKRKVRFGLGSACLAGAAYVAQGGMEPESRSYEWWFDEYAVNRDTAKPTRDLAWLNWLGQPTTTTSSKQGLWSRQFDHGAVVVNPTSSVIWYTPYAHVMRKVGFGTSNSFPVPPNDALFLVA